MLLMSWPAHLILCWSLLRVCVDQSTCWSCWRVIILVSCCPLRFCGPQTWQDSHANMTWPAVVPHRSPRWLISSFVCFFLFKYHTFYNLSNGGCIMTSIFHCRWPTVVTIQYIYIEMYSGTLTVARLFARCCCNCYCRCCFGQLHRSSSQFLRDLTQRFIE